METPELDKLLAVKEKSHEIGKFLEWLLEETEFFIAERDPDGDGLVPTSESFEQILGRYFDIDLEKCEEERQELVSEMRAMSNAKAQA